MDMGVKNSFSLKLFPLELGILFSQLNSLSSIVIYACNHVTHSALYFEEGMGTIWKAVGLVYDVVCYIGYWLCGFLSFTTPFILNFDLMDLMEFCFGE